MEQELFFSGYCRIVDGSRTVEVITEDGHVTEADCQWGHCGHEAECTIGQQITRENTGK